MKKPVSNKGQWIKDYLSSGVSKRAAQSYESQLNTPTFARSIGKGLKDAANEIPDNVSSGNAIVNANNLAAKQMMSGFGEGLETRNLQDRQKELEPQKKQLDDLIEYENNLSTELGEQLEEKKRNSDFFLSNKYNFENLARAKSAGDTIKASEIVKEIYNNYKGIEDDGFVFEKFYPEDNRVIEINPQTGEHNSFKLQDTIVPLAFENLPKEEAEYFARMYSPHYKEKYEMDMRKQNLDLIEQEAKIGHFGAKDSYLAAQTKDLNSPKISKDEIHAEQAQLNVKRKIDRIEQILSDPSLKGKLEVGVAKSLANKFVPHGTDLGYSEKQAELDQLFKDLKNDMFAANPSLRTNTEFEHMGAPSVLSNEKNMKARLNALKLTYYNSFGDIPARDSDEDADGIKWQ